MVTNSVIICGAGGQGRVVADLLERSGRYRIAGFLDDNRRLAGHRVAGYDILGCVQEFLQDDDRGCWMLLAIGSNEDRLRLVEELTAAGSRFAMAIHPSAQIGRDVVIGPGTVIMANAVVNTGARIGAHVIINTAATVDHDCLIEDFAHIGPGSHLAGAVTVGRGAQVGIGASAVPGVHIGCWTVVGAGATVIQDLPSDVIAAGTPAVRVGDRVMAGSNGENGR